MIERGQIYKCAVCGNIIEVLVAGGGELVCCGQPMQLLAEKTGDQGMEKHTPILEEQGDSVVVKVGSIPHPMEAAHWIQWIEIVTKDKTCREYVSPGQAPQVVFPVKKSDILMAREHCNLHGLWKSA